LCNRTCVKYNNNNNKSIILNDANHGAGA